MAKTLSARRLHATAVLNETHLKAQQIAEQAAHHSAKRLGGDFTIWRREEAKRQPDLQLARHVLTNYRDPNGWLPPGSRPTTNGAVGGGRTLKARPQSPRGERPTSAGTAAIAQRLEERLALVDTMSPATVTAAMRETARDCKRREDLLRLGQLAQREAMMAGDLSQQTELLRREQVRPISLAPCPSHAFTGMLPRSMPFSSLHWHAHVRGEAEHELHIREWTHTTRHPRSTISEQARHLLPPTPYPLPPCGARYPY